jgi:hypothetical protein
VQVITIPGDLPTNSTNNILRLFSIQVLIFGESGLILSYQTATAMNTESLLKEIETLKARNEAFRKAVLIYQKADGRGTETSNLTIKELGEVSKLLEFADTEVYRDYKITRSSYGWEYTHKDYDGPEDHRLGTVGSIEKAKAAIDEYIQENEEADTTIPYKGFSIEISMTAPSLYTVKDPAGNPVDLEEENNLTEIKCMIDYLAELWEKETERLQDEENRKLSQTLRRTENAGSY